MHVQDFHTSEYYFDDNFQFLMCLQFFLFAFQKFRWLFGIRRKKFFLWWTRVLWFNCFVFKYVFFNDRCYCDWKVCCDFDVILSSVTAVWVCYPRSQYLAFIYRYQRLAWTTRSQPPFHLRLQEALVVALHLQATCSVCPVAEALSSGCFPKHVASASLKPRLVMCHPRPLIPFW